MHWAKSKVSERHIDPMKESAVPPNIRILWDDDADQSIPLPSYETQGAAGADIRANLPPDQRAHGMTLAPMERCIIPTGMRIEIPRGFEVQLRPRSGLALKHGISLANTPGTIDSDYRGPLGVLLINLGSDPFVVRHGDRIAQAIVAPVTQAVFQVTGQLSDTKRGTGGFGSTGQS